MSSYPTLVKFEFPPFKSGDVLVRRKQKSSMRSAWNLSCKSFSR